jgi:CRP-like cAMP-binding protein/predicted MFS family arabinose efflux permease
MLMTDSAPPSLSSFAVFRNRNFSLLWSGQLVSTIGSSLTSLAASIYVFRLTDSALSVGLMLMATAAPSLLVGLFAGVFVDRYDRKKIMITADLIRAVLVVLIPFLVPLNLIWLYIIVMLTSAIGQFFDPAHESVLPEVASDEELAAANSLMAISSFGSTAVGFAAAGLIASAADISWAFYIDAATFLLSALCIYLINIKPFSAEDETSVSIVISNLRAGLRQLFNTPILRSLFTAQVPVLIAFGLSNTLLLPFALRALKATEFEYGLQEGLTSIGFVVGSLLMANVFDRMREGVWIAVSFLGMAVAGIIYSSLHSIPFAILIVTISGFFNAPSSIARRVIVQRNTPRDMRGRVNSVFFVARDVLFLIGMGAAGLADAIDVRLMYLVSALILLTGGILVLVLPGLRQEGAEWRQSLRLLRTAPGISGLGAGRSVLLADMALLVDLVPSLSALTAKERESLLRQARVIDAPEGTTVLRHGEKGDAAYFILNGKVVAGITSAEGNYQSLENMTSGDFFGEIAALTGTARTADVVATDTTTLMRIPAQALRDLMSNPVLGALFLSKMTERLNRFSINELPRFAGYDQQVMRDLRTAPAEG